MVSATLAASRLSYTIQKLRNRFVARDLWCPTYPLLRCSPLTATCVRIQEKEPQSLLSVAMLNKNTLGEALGNLGIKVGVEPSTNLSLRYPSRLFTSRLASQPPTNKHNKSIYLHFEIIMVLLTSTFLTLLSWAAGISAATVNMVKKDCTLMTSAELGALSPQAHNAIDAAALADHGDHSHNLVVNDPDVRARAFDHPLSAD
ncbi:hypothetical protein B0H14DRAFT_2568147 [Mycena olivaceomarginata]|nr:hypothetical protein B0H14DRAFT_2568147 [Mycena olivaceomarginata]